MIIGIDPGNKGAIATITGNRVSVRPMPTLALTKSKRALDEAALVQFFIHRRRAIQHVFIEKVHAMPHQGVTSCFSFGCGWGILRGICAALYLPYTLVHSTTWKGKMCRDLAKSKDASITVAKRLWPMVNLFPTPRSRKENDGMADALLIAEYGRRILNGSS